nr:ribonuclease H-like domain-containing protein [Tanacetum cinerariifolium]
MESTRTKERLQDLLEDLSFTKTVRLTQTTANTDGTSTSTILDLVTTEEKAQKKNDVKARSMLLMANPNEHLLTFSQYKDAKTSFKAIQARFDESLDSIFNRLQKIRNKADLDTMSIDDLYNNFKIIEQEVKRTVALSLRSQNMAFLSSPDSTNEVDTANIHVSTVSTPVSTVSSHDNTANLSDATVYFQRTGKKITIIGSDTAEDTSSKAMVAIDETCFDWSYMADDEVLTNMALMAFSDSDVQNIKTYSNTCLKSFETLKTQYDNLRIEFNKSEFDLATYKRGTPQDALKDQGYFDSGYSRHMIGNISYLTDFKEHDRGYVAFGGGVKGGKITGKGTIRTVDESQVLLKVPRKNNMYNFDMKNIVLQKDLTCLLAKATNDESMLWHKRLGYINYKNINKLVKDNLVRGLPSKRFKNNHNCVACLKGKQHKVSFKSKL